MFYAVVNKESFIARANMDGTNETRIIFGDHVTNPDGLAIDFISKSAFY